MSHTRHRTGLIPTLFCNEKKSMTSCHVLSTAFFAISGTVREFLNQLKVDWKSETEWRRKRDKNTIKPNRKRLGASSAIWTAEVISTFGFFRLRTCPFPLPSGWNIFNCEVMCLLGLFVVLMWYVVVFQIFILVLLLILWSKFTYPFHGWNSDIHWTWRMSWQFTFQASSTLSNSRAMLSNISILTGNMHPRCRCRHTSFCSVCATLVKTIS